MENKYYTPEDNEFHIGFEYESGNKATLENITEWFEEVIEDKIDLFSVFDDYTVVRVKYLDEQDILDCGFEYTNDKRDLVKNNIRLRPYIGGVFKIPELTIYKNSERIFSGQIRNKSKFKEILKIVIYKR